MPLALEIVTPERRVARVTCDEVRAPGALGGFGIRPGHTAFMTALEPGGLTYLAEGREHRYFVAGGFLQVVDDQVTVLADAAEAQQEIDVERAQRALAEARERLKSLTELDEHYPVESARVRRAAARLHVAGRT